MCGTLVIERAALSKVSRVSHAGGTKWNLVLAGIRVTAMTMYVA
jgi:hypothetical protein